MIGALIGLGVYLGVCAWIALSFYVGGIVADRGGSAGLAMFVSIVLLFAPLALVVGWQLS